MSNKIRLNISIKLNIAVFFLILMTAFILGYSGINSKINTVKAELKSSGELLAKNLAFNSELGVLASDKDTLFKLVKSIKEEKDVVYVSIVDNQDIVLSEIGAQVKDGSIYSQPIITKVVPKSLGMEAMAIGSDANLSEEKIGLAKVEISLANLYATIRAIQIRTIVLTVILTIIAFLLTIFLTRYIIGPLSSLVEATHKVASGDLSYKVKLHSNDEIGDLTLSFNEMTENLKTAYEKLEKRTQELELTNKELKDTQYKLVQSSKMAAIGQLGAGVAHELNNPLGGILGYAQYTLQKVRKPGFTQDDFKTCQTYIEYIERESLRCKTIVENLLKFSRGPKKEMEDVDLNQVIKDTMPLTGHELRSHRIEIIENYDPELPKIKGNFNKLQQVIVNMMINAGHAIPEGGKLYMTTKTKKSEGGAALAAVVTIEDTGHGISPENMKKLFEPFFTTKIDSKGTGLGLAVSYEIIQEHGGEVGVESQVGKGTKFTLTIPLKNG